MQEGQYFFIRLVFVVLLLASPTRSGIKPNRINKKSPVSVSSGYPLRVYQMYKDKVIVSKPKTYGHWSSWSNWTSCSRSCGGGVTIQTRHCIFTKPNETFDVKATDSSSNKDGLYKKHKRRRRMDEVTNKCIGLYKRIRLCNTQECRNGQDFRAEQCAQFNTKLFKGRFYFWEPYLEGIDECALNCLAVGGGFYATLNKTVIDGTTCKKPTTSTGKFAPIGTKGICIHGYCKSVGSNGVIGAVDELPEECPACIKNTCRSISGLYTRPDIPNGYSLVAQIPKGACRVIVQQLKHTKNILALRLTNGSYIINGDWQFSNSRIVQGAGTQFIYRKQDAASLETITSAGPTVAPIDIVIFHQQPNPGIKYGYSLPPDEQIGDALAKSSNNEPFSINSRFDTNTLSLRDEARPTVHPHRRQRLRRKFIWKVTGLSACSKTCGGGVQQTLIQCVREHSHTQVIDKRCAHLEKPIAHPIRCNTQECPHWGGHWGTCSGSCGQGVQQYLVQCLSENNSRTHVENDALCPQPKPTAASRPCSLPACEEENNELHPQERRYHDWTMGAWSSCSVSCGTGSRTRHVSCPSNKCNQNNRPAHSEYCHQSPCHSATPKISSWLLSEWSQCSEYCGTGSQTRFAVCPKEKCEDAKPETSRACSSDRDCGGKWVHGSWSECSDSCTGQSVQTRDVYCVVKLRGQARITNDKTCPAHNKPDSQRTCDGKCDAVWLSGDWGECSDCPNGIQRRDVKCMKVDSLVVSNQCKTEDMPIIKRSCACPKSSEEKVKPVQDQPLDKNCVDDVKNCYLVVQARLCQYPYYTTHCCVSCRKAQQDPVE